MKQRTKKRMMGFAAFAAFGMLFAGGANLMLAGNAKAEGETAGAEVAKVQTLQSKGASVSITDKAEETQIRFNISLGKAEYETLTAEDSGAEIGVVIIANNLLAGNELLVGTDKSEKATVVSEWQAGENDTMISYAYLPAGEIPEAQYNKVLAARGYVTVDGETTYTNQYRVSMAYIAWQEQSGNLDAEKKATLKNTYMKEYKLSWADGSEETLQYGVAIPQKTATETNAKFLGWYWDQACTAPVDYEKHYVFGNADIYAKYGKYEEKTTAKINEFEVYNNNGFAADISDVVSSGTILSATLGGETLDTANLSIENGILTMPKAEMTQFGEKQLILTVESANGDRTKVTAPILYITKKIATIADMNAMGTYAKQAAGENGGSRYDGYFILTADLDFESDRSKYTSEISNSQGNAFYGTIDGKGHKLLNLTITTKGTYGWNMYFIGKLGNGATVKNLGFINARLGNATEPSGDTFFTSSSGCGLYTIENIYMEITIGASWGRYAFGASAENGLKAKNVVVNMKNSADSVLSCLTANMCVNEGYLQGVYFISASSKSKLGGSYKWKGGANAGESNAPKDPKIAALYASVEAMKAANNDYSEFEKSGYWTIVDGLPVFGAAQS